MHTTRIITKQKKDFSFDVRVWNDLESLCMLLSLCARIMCTERRARGSLFLYHQHTFTRDLKTNMQLTIAFVGEPCFRNHFQ